MKKNTFNTFLILSISMFCLSLNAQDKFWEQASSSETLEKEKKFRKTVPNEYELFSLNTTALKNTLSSAPSRGSLNSNTIVELPGENGILQKFRVFEASTFSPELQALYPDIRSYVGQGIEDPSAIARFSFSEIGLNAMITSNQHGSIYIDPFTQDKNFYISYSTKSLPADQSGFECLVEDTINNEIPLNPINADDGLLRTFRLALACTGEYATFHLNEQGVPGGASDAVKKAAVLSAMNVSMTRLNGIYERDVAVTMELVPNNTDVIFLDPATDPYTNNNGGTMLDQNQTTCDNIIGSANYDIGHVFSTGGGGIAQLNAPCGSGKARGVTGLNSPIGDFFDIDYVAHEMGHQYGANHTQNNNCARSNRSVEPGSASTIMGYAGICAPNVQNNSDDYFHAISIFEMWNFVSTGGGQCGSETATNNDPPTSDAGPNHTMPVSTPFILRGISTDPNGDVLSHSWEQMDATPAQMPPSPNSTVGPAFRSIDPLPTAERYMPMLSTVLNGQTQTTWEVVPNVTRNMNFRYTVRDNVAGGAASASDNVLLSFNVNAGPFEVTSQGTPVTWNSNSQQTITWEVANTDVAPVNSPNVDIMLSLDGGADGFPITILAGTPNDGSQQITVPIVGTTTTEARIMVRGTDHLFYNLNATNFTIDSELGVDEFSLQNFSMWPNPTNGMVNISFIPVTGNGISVSVYDVTGRLVNQSQHENNGATFNQELDLNYLVSGMYFVTVKNGEQKATAKLIMN